MGIKTQVPSRTPEKALLLLHTSKEKRYPTCQLKFSSRKRNLLKQNYKVWVLSYWFYSEVS